MRYPTTKAGIAIQSIFGIILGKRTKQKTSSQSPSKATKEDSMSISSNVCIVNQCDRDIVSTKQLCELHNSRLKKGQPLGGITAYGRGKINPSEIAYNRTEYNSWRAMKGRCYYEKYRAYSQYGGRGIIVCDRWLGTDGFKHFIEDMGKKISPKHTLDRIDNDGNYEPANCRWATKREQVLNRRPFAKGNNNGTL